MSIYSNLAGLYGTNETAVWKGDFITWQPVPVHTVPPERDQVRLYAVPRERDQVRLYTVHCERDGVRLYTVPR